MTTEDMIRALGNVIEEYKNKPVFTGQTNIPMMCRDVIGKLKELSSPWHKGTPTEEGWYLFRWHDDKERWFTVEYLTLEGIKKKDKWDSFDYCKWQKIEEKDK